MLDGVFQRRNNFVDVCGQRAPPLDERPQRDRRRVNQSAVQRDRIEIIVKIRSPATMQRIARPPYSWATVFPKTCPADVRAPLVGEKHIGAPIDALGMALQAPCARGQWRKIRVVSHDDEDVDVLGVRLRGHDRSQEGNASDTGNLLDGRHESAEPAEQMSTLTIRTGVHAVLNRAAAPRERASRSRWNEPARLFV